MGPFSIMEGLKEETHYTSGHKSVDAAKGVPSRIYNRMALMDLNAPD